MPPAPSPQLPCHTELCGLCMVRTARLRKPNRQRNRDKDRHGEHPATRVTGCEPRRSRTVRTARNHRSMTEPPALGQAAAQARAQQVVYEMKQTQRSSERVLGRFLTDSDSDAPSPMLRAEIDSGPFKETRNGRERPRASAISGRPESVATSNDQANQGNGRGALKPRLIG
jgi:hypothetical protein